MLVLGLIKSEDLRCAKEIVTFLEFGLETSKLTIPQDVDALLPPNFRVSEWLTFVV